jgi:hypothetical protein
MPRLQEPMGRPPGRPMLVPREPSDSAARPASVRTMRLILLCLAIGLAGCARLGGGGEPSASPTPKEPELPSQPPIAIPDPIPPSNGPAPGHEEPDATVFDAHPAAIDHFTIGADGRTVVVYWWGGNPTCFGLKGLEVDRHDGVPVITLLEGTRESARDRMCTMEARLKSAVAVLDDPLLVDTANPDAPAAEAIIFEGAQRVSPMSGVREARPHAVSGYVLSADGLTLSIHYVGGRAECYGLASAAARREKADAPLMVTVREGWIAADGVACDDIGVPKFVELTLDHPLLRGVDAAR